MHTTKNDLPLNVRTKLVALLNERLADSFDLYSQCKQAHWNVKGPNFFALHELFDTVAGNTLEYVDLIAERAIQLGGYANGTARQAAENSTLSEYPEGITDGESHVEALASALATFGQAVRAAIDVSSELGDVDTSDLFTEVSRSVDKDLWFVEAHLG